MRAVALSASVLFALPAFGHGGAQLFTAVLRAPAGDTQLLKERLLGITQERLPVGFVIDGTRAWVSLSGPLPSSDIFQIRPLWSAEAERPSPPFTFELRAGSLAQPPAHDGPDAWPVRATLGAPLLREVWVAARRLRKGSIVSCEDIQKQLRDTRRLPKTLIRATCEGSPERVALRDIGAGDVLRGDDFGVAPDVMAGEAVRVSVAGRGISVSIMGTALADGRAGDRIDVRLHHPTRVLRTRVIAPGLAQLADGSP